MRVVAVSVVSALLALGSLIGESFKDPERKVEGSRIISASDPKIVIELPKAATFVGAERWLLYDVADCEIEVFIEADAR